MARRWNWISNTFKLKKLDKGVVVEHIAKMMSRNCAEKGWEKRAKNRIAAASLEPIVSREQYSIPKQHSHRRCRATITVGNNVRLDRLNRFFRHNNTIQVEPAYIQTYAGNGATTVANV